MSFASVNSLVTSVRSRLNITNLNTITDNEIKAFIRAAYKRLYSKVANKHRDYFVTSFRFSLVADQDKYPLPADFRNGVTVWLTFGTGANRQLRELEQFTLNKYRALSASALPGDQWPTMYRAMGKELWLTPAPSQAYVNAIEVLYVPQAQTPVNDDQPLDAQLPNDSESWIEYDTCVQVASRMRLAEYFAMYSKERDIVEADIMAAIVIRDEQPQYMVDAYESLWPILGSPGES